MGCSIFIILKKISIIRVVKNNNIKKNNFFLYDFFHLVFDTFLKRFKKKDIIQIKIKLKLTLRPIEF